MENKVSLQPVNADARPSRLLLPRMALADLIHDRKVALCIIFSLIAVITPLLLLFGLKNGIVSQLRHTLLDDPRTREVRMLGNGNYDHTWLTQLAARPDVGFVIPLTRSLNTQADLVRDTQRFVSNAEIIPTALHDPLLVNAKEPQNEQQVVLSASAAERLQIKIGDSLRLVIARKRDGINEHVQHTLTVIDVVDGAKFARPAAFVTLPLLVAMEDYRDGYQVTLFKVHDGTPTRERTTFAKARLYANSIDSVAELAEWLQQQHIETVTQQAEIESVRAIDHVLGLIFTVIAWISATGCIASLVGAFMANIDRKRKDMAVLRLLGFRRQAVMLFVLIQALLLTGSAWGVGLLLYFVASQLFNNVLGASLPETAFVCHLEPWHLLMALLSVLVVALGVAAVGALRALKIEPAESLREI
ncbi:FtsX-like permease family protein [Xenorhabdus bovienii]|nr:FtsX-like permease family protein [Xenorhabdus bovienii]MDE9552130.1 FtsX-like permease family protein [Xenorhabdus bovienii]MDE9556932.1 FtsX-like permease family protein [Xenorhabdus bovienii]